MSALPCEKHFMRGVCLFAKYPARDRNCQTPQTNRAHLSPDPKSTHPSDLQPPSNNLYLFIFPQNITPHSLLLYPAQRWRYGQLQLLYMSEEEDKLNYFLEFVEIVCSNAGYSRFIDQEMLVDHKTYFDICQLIFSQLRIKLIKIEENNATSPAEKLQQLINLLSQELEIGDFDISGEEILNFNTDHIIKLLEILYQYSKIYIKSKKPTTVVKSQASQTRRLIESQKPGSCSARDPRRSEVPRNEEQGLRQEEEKKYMQHGYGKEHMRDRLEKEEQPNTKDRDYQFVKKKDQSYLIPEEKRKKAKSSKAGRRARSQQQQSKNVHTELAHIIMREKSKMLQAATRDNRKERLEEVKHAKASCNIFLKRYAKENRATLNRSEYLKQKSTVKPVSQELANEDFKAIDNFFESFTYKFRDKKTAYLQKIKRLVRQQQLDRFCYQNKLEREMKQRVKEGLESQLKSISHQHRVRSQLIKERVEAVERIGEGARKELKALNAKNKKELKEAKRQELKRIQNYCRQQNQRVMMSLEEGGRLEQIIMQAYKRF